jgi:hypothetical protein
MTKRERHALQNILDYVLALGQENVPGDIVRDAQIALGQKPAGKTLAEVFMQEARPSCWISSEFERPKDCEGMGNPECQYCARH